MTTDRQQQDLLFKPLIVAGIVIVTFSLACLWIANMVLPQQESEGFKIIGYRFLIGGIISIVIGFVSKHYSLSIIIADFIGISFRLEEVEKMQASFQIGTSRRGIQHSS